MRNAPYLQGRLLIVAMFALPAFVFTSGCKSTTTARPSAAAPTAVATDDATLAGRVKQALAADSTLRSLPISVATYRGVVQLSGYVDSQAQILEALAVTHSVPGVQSVSNDLHLKSQ
ncbi:hyperosmotically inducible protein [Paraburkholderia youngii]|uniref:BON domain-containing protein n=1 Tax=Paraburkholderia youngii TaxID=2782701 RepID=A0A7W8P7M7_9BURK|nr:BON domain-containing protein [Paraburkholderia youngii]MBB5403007.1 osmotically-inducible protein OsmY [Paraburkholderia youngii]NUX54594.1 BON domain-containing protein [Paraburkholderia youngii]NVI04164.1 BON domain-containing protein [Paraburkholderia youngii]